MFYLLLIPPAVMMLVELRYLIGLRKHDDVLFPICQLRRDLLGTMARAMDGEAVSRDDYIYARWMLESLNNVVALYRDYRTRLFNLRAFSRFIQQYRQSAEELSATPRTGNRDLQDIEDRINRAIFQGFLSYTPLLRSEILARVLLSAVPLLARIGLNRMARKLEELKSVYGLLRDLTEPTPHTGQFPAVC